MGQLEYTKTLRKKVICFVSTECMRSGRSWNWIFAPFHKETDFPPGPSIRLNLLNLIEQYLYLHGLLMLQADFVWNQLNFLTDFRLVMSNGKQLKNKNMLIHFS